LPIPDAIEAIIHVCAALAHLHEHGYVHRDSKPANIMLRRGISVLVDFDVAYRLKPGHTPRGRIGTDPDMAPEQCLRGELSPATDLCGVGAVLYEMLTGRWLFETELMGHSHRHTFAARYPQIRGVQPPRPRRFNAQVSAGLEAVVMQCVASQPEQRFSSARALAQELAGFLEGQDRLWPDSLDLQRTMVQTKAQRRHHDEAPAAVVPGNPVRR